MDAVPWTISEVKMSGGELNTALTHTVVASQPSSVDRRLALAWDVNVQSKLGGKLIQMSQFWV